MAGGRRLAALKLLAKKRRIAKDYEVPCLLVADASARTVSLTENVQREAMHPADQFEAFAALVAEGRPIEDIAADFGVTPLVVQRRLKLANVSPRLMADYRAEAVNLDQLMALAITDDHAAQEAAFYDAPQWQRSPTALRERLTEREIDAYRIRWCALSGWKPTRQAGGGIRRDLFAEGDKGRVSDRCGTAGTLAQDKLAGIADEVRAEGWAWVEAVPALTYADLQAFQRARGNGASRTSAKRSASTSCKPSCRKSARPWMPRWKPRTRTRPKPCRRKASAWASSCRRWKMACWTIGANVSRRCRCHRHHRPRRGGRDSSRAAARCRGQGVAHAGEAAARFRRGRRTEDEDEGEDDREKAAHVRAIGAAFERPSYGCAANRTGPQSAGIAGRAGAWHGAERVAGWLCGELPLGVRLTVQDRLEG